MRLTKNNHQKDLLRKHTPAPKGNLGQKEPFKSLQPSMIIHLKEREKPRNRNQK